MRIKIEVYVMSLSILFILLIIKSIDIPIYFGEDWIFVGWKYLLMHNIPTIISLICLVWAVICRKRFINSLDGCQDIPSRIEKIRNGNYEYITFLTTYIIPLICFDLNNYRDCILLVVLLILLGALFVKTNLCYQNPSLALLGFNLYIADIGYKGSIISDVTILSKRRLKKGDSFYKHNIDDLEIVYCSKINIRNNE